MQYVLVPAEPGRANPTPDSNVKTRTRTSVSKLTLNFLVWSMAAPSSVTLSAQIFRSYNLEAGKYFCHRMFTDYDLIHFREHRSFFAPFDKLSDYFFGALHKCAYGTVRLIPYFAFQARYQTPCTLPVIWRRYVFMLLPGELYPYTGDHRDVGHGAETWCCLEN
jgi:hypothetical protein